MFACVVGTRALGKKGWHLVTCSLCYYHPEILNNFPTRALSFHSALVLTANKEK